MEVPPDESELERILEDTDGKDIVEEESIENVSEADDEEIDLKSMKVAELKEMLKSKGLPVSGTKAELIKRLQTCANILGSFYHSGSHNRRIINFGQLYLFH